MSDSVVVLVLRFEVGQLELELVPLFAETWVTAAIDFVAAAAASGGVDSKGSPLRFSFALAAASFSCSAATSCCSSNVVCSFWDSAPESGGWFISSSYVWAWWC